MPRADPNRSDYCASRHLLRNLDSAAQLRRNPLVRAYFARGDDAAASRDRTAADGTALDRLRADVLAALARCSEYAADRTPVALGRIHAVLLRCEIEGGAAPAVAAEIGLSDRQLRRERRSAHDAFLRAFHAPQRTGAEPARACDVATVRLARAIELNELGQTALARSTLASIATAAPSAARRIEAHCCAAEALFEALQHDAVAAHLAQARSIAVRDACDLDDETARTADEHIDFIAWYLRWRTVESAGLATQPPLVLSGAAGRSPAEQRRAVFVRAAAAYAMQRYEVGDYESGSAAVRRGQAVAATLPPSRIKERLAITIADATIWGLRVPLETLRAPFQAIEELARSHGHVQPMSFARAQRTFCDALIEKKPFVRVARRMLGPFGTAERRSCAWTFALAAQLATQIESDARDVAACAQLAESIAPGRTMIAVGARCVRANNAIDGRRYEEARVLAESVYSDAESTGNGRLRGAAARSLAAIAAGVRRRGEAKRYMAESMQLTQRYGSHEALARAFALARRLDVA